MRRAVALFGFAAMLALAWLALLPTRAIATVDGPCTASIDGVNVTNGHDAPDTAVPLQSGEQIPVAGTAQGRILDLSYTVHVAGGSVQVGTVTVSGDGLSWSGTVDLEKISNATVGLFEVTADVETEAGDCTGVAYVCIEGRSPLTTAAGAGATALGVGGVLLLGLSLTRAGRMGGARAGVQGFAGGATAGVGGAVLLQQFCVIPLTTASAAAVPVAIGAAGAVGASLLRRASTRGAREVSQRLRTGRGAQVPGQPVQGTEVTQHLDSAADRGAGTRELADAGSGAGTGAPQAGAGGGPAAGGGGAGGGGAAAPTGGPSPAPGGGGPAAPSGGPSPAPGGGPAGGPSPAPGGGPAPVPPAEGGAVLPPVIPPAADDRHTCSNCGTENTADSRFCTSCGTRLEA